MPEPEPEPEISEQPERGVPATGFGVAALLSATDPAMPVEQAAVPVQAAATGRAAVSVPVQRTPVAAGPSFAYYALADQADQPTGLLVVAMLPEGPRTRRWEASGARSSGSPNPVSRQRAEEISRQAFGFELPSETSLPEVFLG